MEKALTTRIREKFFEELDKKNSWGKNEIKVLYSDVTIEVMTKYLEENSKIE